MQFRITKALFHIGALVLLLAGCAQPSAPTPRPTVVRPETRVLDQTTRQILEEYRSDGTMVFSGPAPYQSGNVLVSEPMPSAPHGLLRKVTKTEQAGSKTFVHTAQAQIGDAIQKGSLRVEQELTPGDVQSTTIHTQGVRSLSGPSPQAEKEFRLGIDVLLSDTDENEETKDDRIIASGEVTFTVKVKVDLDLDCNYACLYDNDLDFLASVGVEQTAALKIAGKGIYGATIKKTVPLKTYTFKSITFYIGPVPVVITPKIVFELRFDGSVGVTISYKASQTLSAVAGVKYDNGWKNISDLKLDFAAGPVDVPDPFTPRIDVKAKAALRGELMFYGVVGPTLEIVPYLHLDLKMPALNPNDPVWKLFGGIEGNVGIRIDVLGFSKHYQTNLWDDSVEIARSDNTAPQVRFLRPDRPDGEVNQCCTLLVQAKDAEDGSSCCAVSFKSSNSADGSNGVLGSGSGQSPELAYTFTTLGARTITATVTDSKGKSSSASVNLNVVNTPPTVAIHTPSSGQQLFRGVSYTLRGVSYDSSEEGYQLPCSAMSWTSDGVGDFNPLIGCQVKLSFPSNGPRTLTLSGTDKYGGSGSATVSVMVVDPPANLPPVVNLTSPKTGISIGPDTVIQLVGNATDPEGGVVTLSWDVLTQYNPATGNGSHLYPVTPAANGDWKPSDSIPYGSPCFSDTLRLRVKAKDPQGNENSDFVVIYVNRLC